MDFIVNLAIEWWNAKSERERTHEALNAILRDCMERYGYLADEDGEARYTDWAKEAWARIPAWKKELTAGERAFLEFGTIGDD